MKIVPDEPSLLLATYLVRQRGSGKRSPIKPKEGVRAVSDSDRVEISEAAREIHLLTQLVLSAPEVRMDRVREVAGKVSGGLIVPNHQIAEGMIRSALMDKVL